MFGLLIHVLRNVPIIMSHGVFFLWRWLPRCESDNPGTNSFFYEWGIDSWECLWIQFFCVGPWLSRSINRTNKSSVWNPPFLQTREIKGFPCGPAKKSYRAQRWNEIHESEFDHECLNKEQHSPDVMSIYFLFSSLYRKNSLHVNRRGRFWTTRIICIHSKGTIFDRVHPTFFLACFETGMVRISRFPLSVHRVKLWWSWLFSIQLQMSLFFHPFRCYLMTTHEHARHAHMQFWVQGIIWTITDYSNRHRYETVSWLYPSSMICCCYM